MGVVILTNSTVVSNTATNQGGGIYNVGAFLLTNGTVADNTAVVGGGIFNVDASSFVTLTNSIVANSLNSNDCSSTGTIVSQGYNLTVTTPAISLPLVTSLVPILTRPAPSQRRRPLSPRPAGR
ncbi:MAG: hypothetical protein R3A44_01660 [Caldilineaceae bacterium]